MVASWRPRSPALAVSPSLLPSIPAHGYASEIADPVRLLVPTVANPFAPGREVAFARVRGALLESLGVREGDHVALWRADVAEHGDLAAVADPGGRAALWRVYPESERLRLSTGDPAQARTACAGARVRGVVVGVLRKFST